MKAYLLCLVLLTSVGCSLRWVVSSAERERAAMDGFYLAKCHATTPGPKSCKDLYDARLKTKTDVCTITGTCDPTVATQPQFLRTGGNSTELKAMINADRQAMAAAKLKVADGQ